MRRGRPIKIGVGPLDSALNLAAAQFAVAKAMCDGEISSEEAAHASSVLEQVGAAHERRDLEARIEALEAIKERSR